MDLSLGAKLALLVLVFPLLLISTLFIVVIYQFRASLEASLVLEAISALFSAVLVDLLVWERLRDSLSKNLKYLHKNVLFKLYSEFRGYDLYHSKDDIRKARIDLERYGRFIGIIPLYPRKLLERIDELLSLHDTFYGNLQKISNLAEKKLGKSLDKATLWQYLGFEPVGWSKPSPKIEMQYKKTAQSLAREQAKLVNETKNLHENLEKTKKQIYEKLEDFLKSNNLRLEEEPTGSKFN